MSEKDETIDRGIWLSDLSLKLPLLLYRRK